MMINPSKAINFEEFLEWYPNNGKRYELIEGVICEMLPTGSHEAVSGFLMAELIQNGETVPLVIEVVSTNWRDDYGHKFVEYEAMKIQEYWIVDYRGLGAVRYIGKPKKPTITICQLIEEEYQIETFIAGDSLKSQVFPDLKLTTDAIFQNAS